MSVIVMWVKIHLNGCHGLKMLWSYFFRVAEDAWTKKICSSDIADEHILQLTDYCNRIVIVSLNVINLLLSKQ